MNIKKNDFLIIGLVGAVGGRLKPLSNILKSILEDKFEYNVEEVRVSELFLSKQLKTNPNNSFDKYTALMDIGNNERKKYNNDILSYRIISYIYEFKKKNLNNSKTVFIINSLKHDDEIKLLREVYGKSFFQISLYESPEVRKDVLVNDIGMSEEQATQLMSRDEGESNDYGQHTRDAFHLADYFIKFDNKNNDQIKNSCVRFLELIFGNPYQTPTFNEFAMYMAFTSSLRSADLSRQVGSVIAKDRNIIATGANDIPKFGGGQYWPEYNSDTGAFYDIKNGRDFMRGHDSNEREKSKIIDEIYQSIIQQFDSIFNNEIPEHEKNKKILRDIIKASPLKDITEYGRVVHAEMDAILSCGRTNNSTVNATMYVTTFPCHNCAKHLIAAGIQEVTFIEPYPKSKALSLWDDSISLLGINTEKNKLIFNPFVGVGPRSFLDLFSMSQGAGGEIIRKKEGKVIAWDESKSSLRLQNSLLSLKEMERIISDKLKEYNDTY